jgi:alanyl-tRNA synthetase
MSVPSKTSVITSPEIVARYLAFFRTRDHLEVPGMALAAPGISTSFVIAGMQPMIPYLRGQMTPPSPRLTSLQRCLRTDDADAVGTNGRKCTSFHMLGNWSIGDYGRPAAIEMAWSLLDDFGLNRESLWVTYFGGDETAGLPSDEESLKEWRRMGQPSERLVPLGMVDNFWTMGGPGPCGPDTEIFVDRGEALGCGEPTCRPGCECERFLEVWNLVFIQYEWLPEGGYASLPLRSVDTGMGLERFAAVLQDVPTTFDIDLLGQARARLDELIGEHGSRSLLPDEGEHGPLAGPGISREERARRMIVDHARATLLALLAGVAPDRDGRGSVVRRLIRLAARQGHRLGLRRPFLGELLEPLAEGHGALLTPEEHARIPELAQIVGEDEQRFTRVLAAGLRELGRLSPGAERVVPGERVFALLADRGFPPDLAAEVLAERDLAVDWAGFERAREAHRLISRSR